MKICEGECSETQYWQKVIVEAELLDWKQVKPIYDKCSELLAVFTSALDSLSQ